MQIFVMILMLLYCSFGCTALSATTKPYPLPENGVRVTGDKIWHNDKLVAELRYFFTAELSDNRGEAYLFNANAQHRGLAIYYFDQDKTVWIFPARGLDDDIKRGYYSELGQSDGYFGWAYDVKISSDGKFVSYKKPGLFSSSTHKYSVEFGMEK